MTKQVKSSVPQPDVDRLRAELNRLRAATAEVERQLRDALSTPHASAAPQQVVSVAAAANGSGPEAFAPASTDRVKAAVPASAPPVSFPAETLMLLDRVAAIIVPDILYVFDVVSGKLLYISDAVFNVLGYQTSQMIELGESLHERLMHDDDRPKVAGHFSRVTSLKPGDAATSNYRMLHADGTWCQFRSRDTTFSRGPDGQLRTVIGVAQDVGGQSLSERSLKEAKEAAETAKRAKDKFMAALSHELRTPLAPVLIATQMLEHDDRLPGDVREELGRVRRNVELESRLIDDLLDLTRSTNGKLKFHLERVAVVDLLRATVQTCIADPTHAGVDGRSRGRIPAVTLSCELQADGVLGDAGRLQQVFWNLLHNAIKFTPDDGTIRISCSNPDPETVRVEFADSGRGVEPALLPFLFNPFEQGGGGTTQRFGGLGMGLAICKALVEGQGGRIFARSDGVGRGATFAVDFPLSKSEPSRSPVDGRRYDPDDRSGVRKAAQPSESGRGGSGAEARRRRILLVEDHEQTARVVKRLLDQLHFDVTWAPSAELALAMAAELHRASPPDEADDASGPFELVLSDLSLPEMNGHEMMSILRDRYGLIGIAMSGYGMDEDIARSKRCGFTLHLVKPVSVEKLSSAIAMVLK